MPDVPPARSVRMIFEFTVDGVRLLEQHPVNVPENVTAGTFGVEQAGDSVEVRDRDGLTVSRVPVWTGLGNAVETFPQDPYISPDNPNVITVVVPTPPEADHVVVRDNRDGGRSGGGNSGSSSAEVLGTFRLQP
jgi:hypothetical protein